MDFKKELNEYVDIVNSELEKYLIRENCPEKRLNESMEYSLISSAKRLRPILMISSYKLFKEDYIKVFPFAIALEMIHNFSLIHDDLPSIDNDNLRHRKAYKSCSIWRSNCTSRRRCTFKQCIFSYK